MHFWWYLNWWTWSGLSTVPTSATYATSRFFTCRGPKPKLNSISRRSLYMYAPPEGDPGGVVGLSPHADIGHVTELRRGAQTHCRRQPQPVRHVLEGISRLRHWPVAQRRLASRRRRHLTEYYRQRVEHRGVVTRSTNVSIYIRIPTRVQSIQLGRSGR